MQSHYGFLSITCCFYVVYSLFGAKLFIYNILQIGTPVALIEIKINRNEQ